MTNEQKFEIQNLLNAFVASFPSDAKGVAALQGVSHATVISMRDGKWDSISDAMWRNVGKQVGWIGRREKQVVETMDFQTLVLYYSIAKEESEVFAITGNEGFGKTFAGEWYASKMKRQNVYYLRCSGYWNKKHFLMELLLAMGKNPDGMNVYEMMKYIIKELRKQDHPLIILDEIDKVDDKVLQFFITLYNDLQGLCGIVWTSTDNIRRRVERGIRLGKTGYGEIFSRIGKNFIELQGTSYEELQEICAANGITSMEDVNRVHNEYKGDLRRVDRVILRETIKKRKNAA